MLKEAARARDGSSPVLLDGDAWQSYFRDFTRSAFRLEVHQTYSMPGEAESVRQFLAGAPMPEGFNSAWHDTVSGHAAAGEDYRIVDLTDRPDPGLPEQDFWLFDTRRPSCT